MKEFYIKSSYIWNLYVKNNEHTTVPVSTEYDVALKDFAKENNLAIVSRSYFRCDDETYLMFKLRHSEGMYNESSTLSYLSYKAIADD